MRPMRHAGYRPAAMVANNASASAVTTLVDVHVGDRLRAAAFGRVDGVERPEPEQQDAAQQRGRARAPMEEITPTSTRCCLKMCRRLAPSARRTPVIGALFRNFASSRPTVFSEAHGQEREREADQHAVVVADDVVVDRATGRRSSGGC